MATIGKKHRRMRNRYNKEVVPILQLMGFKWDADHKGGRDSFIAYWIAKNPQRQIAIDGAELSITISGGQYYFYTRRVFKGRSDTYETSVPYTVTDLVSIAERVANFAKTGEVPNKCTR